MLNFVFKVFSVYDKLKQKLWELKYKGSLSLSDFIYQKEWLNPKVNKLMHKELSKLTYTDASFLLRERVNLQLTIPFALKLLIQKELKISIYYKDDLAIKQRELFRELLLVDFNQWDYNTEALLNLKSILKSKLYNINLPQEYVVNFMKYEASPLTWNEELIKQYNYYLTDNRSGVLYAYSLIISRKRAILNGTSITINSKNLKLSDCRISNIEEFNNYILPTINIPHELKKRLKAEKALVS